MWLEIPGQAGASSNSGVAPANQTKGQKQKIHEFRPFWWLLVFFLRKTSTILIELLFRNAPVKSSWTDLFFWFGLLGPLLINIKRWKQFKHKWQGGSKTSRKDARSSRVEVRRGYANCSPNTSQTSKLRNTFTNTNHIAGMVPTFQGPAKVEPEIALEKPLRMPLSVTIFNQILSVWLRIPWPSLRGSLRNHFWKKKRRHHPYWRGETSGNALEASNALNWRVGGRSQLYSRGEFQ